MNCAVHTDREATGYCRNCGKALCPECTREVRGALYDEECLAGLLAAPLAAGGPGGAGSVPTETNPALAATLGFIPGLGAVYNGEYVKALIQVLIFGGLIAATFHGDTPGGITAIPGNHPRLLLFLYADRFLPRGESSPAGTGGTRSARGRNRRKANRGVSADFYWRALSAFQFRAAADGLDREGVADRADCARRLARVGPHGKKRLGTNLGAN